MTTSAVAGTMAAVVASVAAWGAPQQRPTFRSTANGVLVNATVLASEGLPIRPVDGLTGADFELLDNGVRQPVEAVAARGPIDLTVVVDASDNGFWFAADLRKAIAHLIASLDPDDRIRVLICSNVVREAVPLQRVSPTVSVPPFGTVESPHEQSIVEGVFDAMLRTPDPDRRDVVLAFTSLVDREIIGPGALVSVAASSDALVYLVAWSELVAYPRAFEAATQIVATTGGALFLHTPVGRPVRPPGLQPPAPATSGAALVVAVEAFKDVQTLMMNDLGHSYVLSYNPPGGTAPGWHDIQVKVVRPGSARYVVRARKRYFAADQ